MRRFHGLFTLTALALALLIPNHPAQARDGGGGGGGGGNGPVFTAKFMGAPINGVVPQCECKVDESQALVGGSTIMTITVKNVNLPDGTVLTTVLDFDPISSLTVKGGAGIVVINLGRFAPGGRDTLDIDLGSTFIMGGFL
jgi:hypothetical protein